MATGTLLAISIAIVVVLALAAVAVSRRATTEQLRGAMVHYRALCDELLSDGGRAQPALS